MLGIVIPIFTKKYIKSCIQSIIKNTSIKIRICIVNDGQDDLKLFLKNLSLPPNIYILNLKKNLGFAGANNAGWKYLLSKEVDLTYLGTINDDTKIMPKCIDYCIDSLKKDNTVGMVGPIQIVENFILNTHYATWRFGSKNEKKMICDNKKINNNTYVPVLPGVCLFTKTQILKKVNFFDEIFINSCEDIDLSLKIRKLKYNLQAVHNAYIIHYVGKSRYNINAKTKIDEANNNI